MSCSRRASQQARRCCTGIARRAPDALRIRDHQPHVPRCSLRRTHSGRKTQAYLPCLSPTTAE
ncbi:uncharacterized protein PHACADRAFT_246513 [Phanerochaete carnosa HHB-10118-sp]|uniref:Uncharacterized protein n=1 Tax=Phanerochaete carnosa (strain HHB-10118-sp) TaxID=650164 RepID=K5XC02_PHACS|nr:uncharacterized protein PHACADRAFT_246513 [Phanerochaete carnosa HHB-10118-sp]EKM60517.1 hypothetical protein PHACADRAFT_246513 [Phanerochaete carnosa HHB-10118-sp]